MKCRWRGIIGVVRTERKRERERDRERERESGREVQLRCGLVQQRYSIHQYVLAVRPGTSAAQQKFKQRLPSVVTLVVATFHWFADFSIRTYAKHFCESAR